jgi:hypothetical protein
MGAVDGVPLQYIGGAGGGDAMLKIATFLFTMRRITALLKLFLD